MAATGAAPAALRGIKVLDLSRVLAGPLCSMLLGDWGADVVKVTAAAVPRLV
jgi:crotonobetainyl-CoA:carnitine CoA-transferase CaiB-like acyl-CoA transferase